MIKKKIEKSCALFMILLLTSMPGTETETILKEISSQITEIETTEKKIEDINNFLDEIPKKEKEQKAAAATEKLAKVLSKKKNELLASGLGKIKEETFEKALQIAIKNGEKNTVAEILKRFPEKIEINKTSLDLLTKHNLIIDHKILNGTNIDENKIVVVEKNELEKIINLEEAFKLFSKNPKLLEIKS